MLEHLITSRAKRSLLKLFITSPESSFYTREIARLTGEPVNAVVRELAHLEKAGMVRSYRRGNQRCYTLIKEFPYYPEFKKIIYGTVGIGDYLTDRFKDPEQITLAFIYGSVARNEETSDSDIDLFVVGEIDEKALHSIASQVETDLRRMVNYVLMTEEEFVRRINANEPFVRRVMAEEKIVLKGNPDDYRKAG